MQNRVRATGEDDGRLAEELVGFVVSIAFTYQFKMERLAMHVLCVAAIASLTGFVVLIIYALQYPFAGDVAVSPSAWVEFLQTWARRPL